VGLIVAALFTPLFSSVVQRSVLGGLDQGMGFLFGVVRGVLLVGVAFLVYDRAVAANTVPMVDNSRSAKIFASFQGDIDAAVPTDAPNWIVARYNELTANCAKGTPVPAEPAPATDSSAAPAPSN
jgi:membrane protein required for colicin V production